MLNVYFIIFYDMTIVDYVAYLVAKYYILNIYRFIILYFSWKTDKLIEISNSKVWILCYCWTNIVSTWMLCSLNFMRVDCFYSILSLEIKLSEVHNFVISTVNIEVLFEFTNDNSEFLLTVEELMCQKLIYNLNTFRTVLGYRI